MYKKGTKSFKTLLKSKEKVKFIKKNIYNREGNGEIYVNKKEKKRKEEMETIR